MRAIGWIRNYCVLVFFVVLAGGVILKPGRHPAPSPPTPSAPELADAAVTPSVG